MCGERKAPCSKLLSRHGSSPRVRGTHITAASLALRLRFIPACAGNAGLRQPAQASWTVHPRVCGERASGADTNDYVNGSSPRVRGTLIRHSRIVPKVRFIPACAGNARRDRGPLPRRPVHPRVCGERCPSRPTHQPPAGSSPRVRGTPMSACLACSHSRFIPACAGNACRYQAPVRHAPVHPRVCGERSSPNRMTYKAFHNVKERTDCSSYVPNGQHYSTR